MFDTLEKFSVFLKVFFNLREQMIHTCNVGYSFLWLTILGDGRGQSNNI